MNVPELVQFFLKHYEPARDWDAVKLFEFIYWARGNGYALEVIDEDGSLAGLAIIYPVMHAQDAREESDPEGSCLFVHSVISLKPGVLKAFGFAVLRRFGMRNTIAWSHPPYDVIHEYPAKMVRRNLLRMTREFQTKETN